MCYESVWTENNSVMGGIYEFLFFICFKLVYSLWFEGRVGGLRTVTTIRFMRTNVRAFRLEIEQHYYASV